MNTNKLAKVNVEERKALDFSSGDTIKVWNKLKDKDGKIRLQAFEGLVLARKHGTDISATFTVRKVASGVGVEKIYPLYSSNIDKIEIMRRAKARRSKLYYVRDKALRDVRRKLKTDTRFIKKDGVTTKEIAQDNVENEVVEEVNTTLE